MDAHTRSQAPKGQLALTGPGVEAEAGHLPVRGDLAHIALAGRYFVPHYAVPMPHVVITKGATLHSAPAGDAAILAALPLGTCFDVLDINGAWAWGQLGVDGLVGYTPIVSLEAQSA